MLGDLDLEPSGPGIPGEEVILKPADYEDPYSQILTLLWNEDEPYLKDLLIKRVSF